MKNNITNINVHALNLSTGIKVFEFLNSMLQAHHPEFKQQIQITISEKQSEKQLENNKSTINILFVDMPDEINVDLDSYDLVLFSNSDEPLQCATSFIVKNIHKENCYLVANSVLTNDHVLHDSVIPYLNNDLLICRQYWTNPVYPQYYSNFNLSKNFKRDKNLFFINGENRSWRHHLLTLMHREKINFELKSTISNKSIIHETNDAHWESKEDAEFRSQVNKRYNITRRLQSNYYNNSIQVGLYSGCVTEGLENKVSLVPQGYFILSEYYQYRCVMFPETAWQNNELSITEKSCKCFYSGAVPWPVGGANINRLYNQIGFKTAWNLLPNHLKEYDYELDHFKRYEKLITSVKWLQDNLYVLSSKAAENISKENKQRFLDHNISQITAEQLWSAIKNSVKC